MHGDSLAFSIRLVDGVGGNEFGLSLSIDLVDSVSLGDHE